MKPDAIEQNSFQIIEEEAGVHGFSSRKWQIVRRMIHTTADFEFVQSVRFHAGAIDAGLAAIGAGKPIFTDTNMARVGLRQKEMTRFNVTARCLISDPAILKIAREKETTRARAAVDAAAPHMAGAIYAVGNAPTALLRLMELIREGVAAPGLIVGLPVGFVNAAESKEELIAMDYPYISNVGRKGGSNLSAAVVNALLIMAASES